MRERLVGLLEQADLAIGACAGVVGREQLEPAIGAVRSARLRLSYPPDVLVVAIAGGTGSGKSSLLNAMCGQDLADVGGMRPTTEEPMAVVPAGSFELMGGYLDAIGVSDRRPGDLPGICLIDLPDIDSVRTDNRHRVDSLLPLVDLVLWVTDPEKYRDARLHHEYLAPAAGDPGQMLVALNQADRVAPEELAAITADLARALGEDGLGGVAIHTISAAPPAGPPVGLDELLFSLESKREDRDLLFRRLVGDLDSAFSDLTVVLGAPLDFDARAVPVVAETSTLLATGDIGAASTAMTGFLDEIAAGVGGLAGRDIEGLSGEVAQHLARIAPTAARPARRWPWHRVPSRPTAEDLAPEVTSAIVRPVRVILARRALAAASLTELAVASARLRASMPR